MEKCSREKINKIAYHTLHELNVYSSGCDEYTIYSETYCDYDNTHTIEEVIKLKESEVEGYDIGKSYLICTEEDYDGDYFLMTDKAIADILIKYYKDTKGKGKGIICTWKKGEE